MKQIAVTFSLIVLLGFTTIAQSDAKEKTVLMDTIPVLVFNPGDSVMIEPNGFFYYDNEKVVNGPSNWLLTDFTIHYFLVPHREEESPAHSSDWFSQLCLAKYLRTLSQEDFEAFVRLFLFTESDLEELGEVKEE